MWRTCSFASSSSVRSTRAKPCSRVRGRAARSRRGRCTCDADEDVRLRRVGDAVVELGDVARRRACSQKRRKLPRSSGIVTANRASRCLADLGALGDEAQPVEVHVRAAGDRDERLARSARVARRTASSPATPSAPAGSRIARVSSNTSLIAAQTASVSTTTNSSTSSRHRRNVSSPTCLTAVPSENRPTSVERDALARPQRAVIASESAVSTPMTLISGRTRLDVGGDAGDQAAAADRRRRPRRSARWCWRRISMPTVPWPAITSGSSNGWTKVSPRRCSSRSARARRRRSSCRRAARPRPRARATASTLICGVVTGMTITRAASEPLRGQGHALGVVAAPRRRSRPRASSVRRELRHLVVGAAELEAEHRLLVLALQQQLVAEAPGRAGAPAAVTTRSPRRRGRVEDSLQIVDGAGRRSWGDGIRRGVGVEHDQPGASQVEIAPSRPEQPPALRAQRRWAPCAEPPALQVEAAISTPRTAPQGDPEAPLGRPR